MPEYRLTKNLDWSQLHNERVRIDVSDNYVVAVKRDGTFVMLAQVVHPRRAQPEPMSAEANGNQPVESAASPVPAAPA